MTPPPNPIQMLANAAIAALPYPEIQNLVNAIASVNQALVAKWDTLFRNAFANWPLIEKDTLKFHAASLRSLLDVVEESIAAAERAAAQCHQPVPCPTSGPEKITVS